MHERPVLTGSRINSYMEISTMTISGNSLVNAIVFSRDPAYLAQRNQDDAELQLITGEDRSFLNARGISGNALYDADRVMCVAERIYADPANPDKRMQVSDLAYYGGEVAKHNESAITSLGFMLRQPFLDETVKANMQQTLDNLVSTRETAKGQMTNLLAEAKLLLMQRGVHEEAQVIETMEMIDAVLRNMQSVEGSSSSGYAAKFLDLYSKEVKRNCEIAVGRGRDPFPMMEHMSKSRGSGAPDEQRLQKAIESVRPQARAMADKLKELLAPFAQPLHQDASPAPTQDKAQGKVLGTWQLA